MTPPRDGRGPDRAVDGRIVDWTLGQLPADEERALRQRVQEDPRAALAAGEVRALLEDMRTLTVQRDRRAEAALRYAVQRRIAVRRGSRAPEGATGFVAVLRSPAKLLRVAAVAAVMLGALLLWRDALRPALAGPPLQTASPEPAPPARALAAAAPERPQPAPAETPTSWPLPALERETSHDALELAEADPFTRVLRARNEVALLRLEFEQRFSRQARRASITQCGGKPDLDDRVQELAASIAAAIEHRLSAGTATTAEAAFALRALLAAGSRPGLGVHRAEVAACFAFLEERIDRLEGGELATALAAVTDYAVATGGRAADLVARHGDRLASSTVSPPHGLLPHSAPADAAPPEPGHAELLRFDTPVACLADAGHVLRLAPAFGVHPAIARAARLRVVAHLDERLAMTRSERPGLLAALLYGFGDLVDRWEIDSRLVLWPPTLLAQTDLVAVHHITWSQLPPRAGWAQFQRELRKLATKQTPSDVCDASALLLSLAMNFAAPGVRQVVAIS